MWHRADAVCRGQRAGAGQLPLLLAQHPDRVHPTGTEALPEDVAALQAARLRHPSLGVAAAAAPTLWRHVCAQGGSMAHVAQRLQALLDDAVRCCQRCCAPVPLVWAVWFWPPALRACALFGFGPRRQKYGRRRCFGPAACVLCVLRAAVLALLQTAQRPQGWLNDAQHACSGWLNDAQHACSGWLNDAQHACSGWLNDAQHACSGWLNDAQHACSGSGAPSACARP